MTIDTNPPRLKVANTILDAVRTLTEIFPKEYQVTLNKPNISLGADYWFVLTPAGWQATPDDTYGKIIAWRFRCEIAVRFAEYNSRTEKFVIACEAVRIFLETPNVLKNIQLKPPVFIVGEDLTQDQPGLQPNWIVQPMTITINQRASYPTVK